MDDEARKARNAYKRDWNHKHKDKVKQYQRDYWKRKAEREAATKAAQDQTEQEARA